MLERVIPITSHKKFANFLLKMPSYDVLVTYIRTYAKKFSIPVQAGRVISLETKKPLRDVGVQNSTRLSYVNEQSLFADDFELSEKCQNQRLPPKLAPI